MATLGLSSTNLSPGSTIKIETSALPGGELVLQAASSAAPRRFLALTDALSDGGIPLTAAAGTPSGAVGISRTAGTSLVLVGEATSSSAKTNKALWNFNLPFAWNGGGIVVDINAQVTGTGTLTAASTTLNLAAYSEVSGVETALTVAGGAQQINASAIDCLWTIAATGLSPGENIAIEATMLVTSSSGANTGQINSASIAA